MSKSGTKWSPSEEKVLITLYHPFWFTRENVAERVGRSVRAVRDKLRRMGIKKNPWRRWTQAEDLRVLEMTKSRPMIKAEGLPGRSRGALRKRLHDLRRKQALA